MNIATLSSTFRFALASGALALTAGLFAAGCGSEASESPAAAESVDHGSQALATAPTGTTTAAPIDGVRRYPPHGYPCLGCHPCGDSYCDNNNNMVVCAGNGGPVAK